MLKLKDVCSCIRLLHPDLQQRVKPDTLRTYKQHLDPFLAYLSQKWELQQLSPEDVDLLIMEYRTEFDITRSQHSQLVAAVEFFVPHTKHHLVISREALKGRLSADPIQHTTPLTYEIGFLFAAHFASLGQQRLGAAMLVQLGTGLRPSGLLGLKRDHVHVPVNPRANISLRLGVDFSTKIKREQFVLIDPVKQPLTYRLVKKLHINTCSGGKLFPFGYSTYNNSFKIAEEHFGLALHMTAHSGRAGFATSRVMAGDEAKQVQADGRWISESSFRTYVDVVGSLHVRSQVALINLSEAARWCEEHIDDYFKTLASSVNDKKESGRQCGDAKTRLEAQRELLLGSASTRSLHPISKETMERRTPADIDDTNLRLRGKGASFTGTSKGKGRGKLLPVGRTSQSLQVGSMVPERPVWSVPFAFGGSVLRTARACVSGGSCHWCSG